MQGSGYREILLYARDGSVRARVLVDELDFDALSAYRWHLDSKGYVYRHDWHGNRDRPVRLHRQIMGLATGDPGIVDHVSGDKLDNRRANLRVGTQALNQQNRRKRAKASSKHRGVTLYRNGKWMAQCHIGGKMHHLGYFDDEDEAGRVVAAFRAERMPWATT